MKKVGKLKQCKTKEIFPQNKEYKLEEYGTEHKLEAYGTEHKLEEYGTEQTWQH